MAEKFEVVHSLGIWNYSRHAYEGVGLILRDVETGEEQGYTFDEALELILKFGATNATAERTENSRSITPKEELGMPGFSKEPWIIPALTEEHLPHVEYSLLLSKHVHSVVTREIKWNIKRYARQQSYRNFLDVDQKNELRQLASWLLNAQHIAVLTGAGISTESGIPDFRSSQDSLYSGASDAVYMMSTSYAVDHPEQFWGFFSNMIKEMMKPYLPIQTKQATAHALEFFDPNRGHQFLADLEKSGKDVTIVTQNVDDLHEKAGSSRVLHLHGEWKKAICPVCGAEKQLTDVLLDEVYTCPKEACSGMLRPNLVLFGDAIWHAEEAEQSFRNADVILVIGTSLDVYPANMFPFLDGKSDVKRVFINGEAPDRLEDFDLVLQGSIGDVLRKLQTETDDQQGGNHSGKPRMICNVCKINEAEGVFASQIVPVSLAYCMSCMHKGAESYDVLVMKLALRRSEVALTERLRRIINASLEVAQKTEEEFWEDVMIQKEEFEKKKKKKDQ